MADDSYQMPERTASASTKMASEPARGAMKIRRVEIEPTDNGGFIVTCIKEPTGKGAPMPAEPKRLAFGSYDEAEAYTRKELVGATPPSAAPINPAPNPPSPRPAPPAAVAPPRPMGDMASASGPRY
jgi:hypothetical protein